ncbi:gliding motility-associated C-terminal domain-containing protein, partial [Flavobacterium sp. FBOR7N2.3]
YTFTVTNTGNVTVDNIVINDAKLGVTNLALVPSTLAPSATGVVTQDYAITQADIDARKVTNTAIAKGQDPKGVDVEDISGTAVDNDEPTVTDLPENGKIALILKGELQDENQDGLAQIGETIRYEYTIMNMGDVPLSNVWIQDAMVGLGMNSGTIDLPIGAMDSTTFSSTYVLTQADIIAGNVSNQATVFGTTPLGSVVQDLSHDTSPLEDGFTVIDVDGCQLAIFNAVSPNSGTEYERILYIRGLDCYPDNTVQIFDRWGVKVYEVNGYDNNTKAFRGISEGRVTVNQSKGLADGTYFYIINYVDKDGKGNNKSGYLHLIND